MSRFVIRFTLICSCWDIYKDHYESCQLNHQAAENEFMLTGIFIVISSMYLHGKKNGSIKFIDPFCSKNKNGSPSNSSSSNQHADQTEKTCCIIEKLGINESNATTQILNSYSWRDGSSLYFQWMLRKFHWKSSMKNQHRNKVELPALHLELLIIWKLSLRLTYDVYDNPYIEWIARASWF